MYFQVGKTDKDNQLFSWKKSCGQTWTSEKFQALINIWSEAYISTWGWRGYIPVSAPGIFLVEFSSSLDFPVWSVLVAGSILSNQQLLWLHGCFSDSLFHIQRLTPTQMRLSLLHYHTPALFFTECTNDSQIPLCAENVRQNISICIIYVLRSFGGG